MEITLLVVKMILSCYQFIGNNTNISKIEAIQFKLSYVTVDDLYIFPSPHPSIYIFYILCWHFQKERTVKFVT